MVDGYAVVASDLVAGAGRLQVVEEVFAGAVPRRTVFAGQATRIMTGAPMPAGADAVVMVETTTTESATDDEHEVVVVEGKSPTPGQHILRRGTVMRRGEAVLPAGTVMRPAAVGLCAEIGFREVRVVPRPSVAILATGNELVAVDEQPAAGQIRNSNGPLLMAAVERAGGKAIDAGIARDEPDELRRAISEGLEADVLVLSGGVSAGVLDLVPQVLAELGVEEQFHKVRIKPGKPVWFGVLRRDAGATLVFGLPGNPVSSFVCFEIFTRAALDTLAGREPAKRRTLRARLSAPFRHRGDRPTYFPVRLAAAEAGATAEPLDWRGSADLRSVALADGLAFFAAGEYELDRGAEVTVTRV